MPGLKYRKTLDNISSYVPAKSMQVIEKELGLNQIIRLAANENRWGYSPLVETAIKNYLKDIYLYPDGFCAQLRNTLAEKNSIKENQLIFGNGSFELLSLIAQTFINPGEESIIPDPSFGWYKVVTLIMGGVVKSVPLKKHVIDLEAVKKNISDKTKVIWLCNPNNPTGTIIKKHELEEFLGSISSDIIIVLDEAYYDFVTSKDYPDSIELINRYTNIIVLRTFSKVYGLASLRIGFGIANYEIIDSMNKIRLPINVNYIAQVAAAAALKDEDFRRNCVENNIREREYFYKSFKEMNLEYIETECNFIMVNVFRDSADVSNEILKRGIAVRAGTEFNMPQWLRITIGKPEENQLVIKELKQVLE